MNPSINLTCSNLKLGVNYCVAPVNGTDVPIPTTTLLHLGPRPCEQAVYNATSSTSTYPMSPAHTVTGTISDCNTFYATISGDTRANIESTNSINLSQFRSWNTYFDSLCDNLWSDYAYCVSSPIGSHFLRHRSNYDDYEQCFRNKYVSAPTQTVSGTISDCAVWHTVKSGDTCESIEITYSITLAQFPHLEHIY